MKNIFLSAILFWIGIDFSCGQAPRPFSSLRFLGEYEIPFVMKFDSTIVGGLSGIDYDKKRDQYYAISDDRGSHGYIRFYTLKFDVSSDGLKRVRFLNVKPLLSPKSRRYDKNIKATNPDPESIRLNTPLDELLWVSEGERIVGRSTKSLTHPLIYTADLNGKYKTSYPLPENVKMQAISKGPRQNSALEGTTFNEKFTHLYVALEEPLHEDGPRADTVKNNATTRIFKFDVATRKLVASFAYPLEKVAYPPSPPDKFRINGVSEIVHAGGEWLITVERSFSTGRLPCTVKLFLTDLSTAQDITKISSLAKEPKVRAAAKTLLLNLDELGIYIDNVEGITFGPRLPNGNQTLILVTDNNFNWFEKTQLLLFEVVP